MTSTPEPQSTPKIVWQAEQTHPDLMQPFKEAMCEIVDPEIGLNIIQLGLVRDLLIEDNQAKLTMILTTPYCPYGPAMLETARQKAETALKRPTVIDYGMEVWDFSMMEEGVGSDWGLF